jgi:hypothetical protein
VRGRRRGEPAVRGPVLRRRDGLQHRPHWQDPVAGLREMRRVARRVVVFTFDASEFAWRRRFWLTRDYLPEAAGLVAGWLAAAAGRRDRGPGGAGAHPVGLRRRLLEAYWRRPEAYLEEHVRRACSVWTRSDRRPSSGRCAASAMTSPRGGGPSATATSPTSTRQNSACACSWPEPRARGRGRRGGRGLRAELGPARSARNTAGKSAYRMGTQQQRHRRRGRATTRTS